MRRRTLILIIKGFDFFRYVYIFHQVLFKVMWILKYNPSKFCLYKRIIKQSCSCNLLAPFININTIPREITLLNKTIYHVSVIRLQTLRE